MYRDNHVEFMATNGLTVEDSSPRARRQFFLLLSAMTAMLTVCGCQRPPAPPSWLADSSGVIVEDDYFKVATKQTLKLKSPLRTEDFDLTSRLVDVKSQKVIHVGINWKNETDREALITVVVTSGLTAAPGKPMQLQVTLPRWKTFDIFELELHQSSNCKKLLLCIGFQAVIIDLESRHTTGLPHITPPFFFNRIFGISPCRPDGAGFIALRRNAGLTDEGLTKRHENLFLDFLNFHLEPVFVGWDGTVTALEGMDSLKSAESMFRHCFFKSNNFPGTIRFCAEANWRGTALVMTFVDARLEVDTMANVVRYVPSETKSPEEFSSKGLAQMLALNSVEMNNGEYRIFVRPREPNSLTRNQSARMQVLVWSRQTGTERIIHENVGDWEAFDLRPSPDRKSLLLMYAPQGFKQYSVLLNHRGEYLASVGIREDTWSRPAAIK
jgi:hypothetical protein